MVTTGTSVGQNVDYHDDKEKDQSPMAGQTALYEPPKQSSETLRPFTAMRLLVGTGVAGLPPVRKAILASLARAKDPQAVRDESDDLQTVMHKELLSIACIYAGEGTTMSTQAAEELAQEFVDSTIPLLRRTEEKRASKTGKAGHVYPQLVIPKDGSAIEGSTMPNAYRLIHKIGQGGFGSVWKGVDQTHCVAVKLLDVQTSQSAARFSREASISELANPSGAIPVFYEHTGASTKMPHGEVAPHIVSEFVEGQTLDRILKETPEPKVLRYLFYRIVQKLADIRKTVPGFVHRDIKPQNIMVTSSPHLDVEILDLGMARADAKEVSNDPEATADLASLTQEGTLMGTPEWMSPEQISGKWSNVGPRSDLWSLGSVFFKAIQGEFPNMSRSEYAERMGKLNELLLFLSAERQKPISEDAWAVVEEFDADFAALLRRVLCVDPNERMSPEAILARAKELSPSVTPHHRSEPSSAETALHMTASSDTPHHEHPTPQSLREMMDEQLSDVPVRKLSATEKLVRGIKRVSKRSKIPAAAAAVLLGIAGVFSLARNDHKDGEGSAPVVEKAKDNVAGKEAQKHPAVLTNVDMQHPENVTLELLGGANLKAKASWKFSEQSLGAMFDCEPDQVEPLLRALFSKDDAALWECIQNRLRREKHINGNSVRAYGYVAPSGSIIDICDHCTLIFAADGRMKYFLSDVTGDHPKTDDPKKLEAYKEVDKTRIFSGKSGRFTCAELLKILDEIPAGVAPSKENADATRIHARLENPFRRGQKMYSPKNKPAG